MRKTVVLMMVLAASAAVAQAEPLKLMVGAASSPGDVTFTLSQTTTSVDPLLGTPVSSTASVAVNAYVSGPMSAVNKAALIGDAVVASGVFGTWRAVAVPGMVAVLTFEHEVGNVWIPVDSISGLLDTTGSGTLIYTAGQAVGFSLGIDPMAVATGFDALWNPSFLSISVTNTLSYTRAVQAGDKAEILVSDFVSFLAAQATLGVHVTRTSPTTVNILVTGTATAALSWQVTDTGLLGMATASAMVAPTIMDSSLIDK